MSSVLDTVPKTLPIDNPLLFAFLMIIDAIELQVKFNGKYSRSFEKDLPAFEYAVNAWRVVEDPEDDRFKFLEQDILCALWKDKPEESDCEIEWQKFPEGEDTTRVHEMSYTYNFEEWRDRTFQELDQIISLLTYKKDSNERGVDKKEIQYLSQIFGFENTDNTVSYVYAKDSTANKFYGVGATFTLRSPFKSCCPKINETSIQLNYFKSLGFEFE